MLRPPDPARPSRWLAIAAGLITVALGAAELIAGSTPSGTLPGMGDAAERMHPAGQTGLALAGTALVLLAGSPGPGRRRTGYALGAVAAALGLLGVLTYLLPEAARRVETDARVVAPAAAVSLGLAGLSLALLDLPSTRRIHWPQALAPAAAAPALVTMLAYLFDAAGAAPGPVALAAMPAVTATGVLVLSAGVLLARPRHSLLRPYGRLGPGGAFARRLVPLLLGIPLGVVLVSAAVIRLGRGQPALVFSLTTALFVLVTALLMGRTVRLHDEADARRDRLLDELSAERDFTRTLLQSLSEGVVVFDRDLCVIDTNPRACELVGQPRAELIGQRPPYSWQPEPDRPPPLSDSAGGDRLLRRPDGTTVPVLARMSPVLDPEGRPRAFVGTFVDITERKQAERALAARATDLERVNERLRQGNRALEEAAQFKGDLMSIVSHEVSQPLSSVASLSELLAADWGDLPDDIRQELATKIDKNTRRLTRLINDMLLLFRLDAGAVSARRDSVPIAEVVETVMDTVPADVHVATSIDPDVCALVDRAHLWQVLSNLVSNALAYGEPPIEIGTETGRDGVVVTVRDYGPGIPQEQLPHLFGRIARRQPGGGRRKGSGLGLFIVRHLVEVNGGSIWYERADPRGAKLLVRLERAPGPTDKARKPATAPKIPAPHT